MIRLLTLSIAIVCLSFSVYGRNLIPNGSFEAYSTCPTTLSQLSLATGWDSYTFTTPDYFNSCNVFAVGVPTNGMGNQAAYQGNAYAGLISLNAIGSLREYIHTVFPALVIGREYKMSISVSLANNSSFGINKLGVYFFKNGPTSMPGYSPLLLTPQVDYSNYGPVTDTANWVRLSKNFIADSNYTNLIIGCFEQPSNIIMSGFTAYGYAYYYIDSVVLEAAHDIYINYPSASHCIGDTISVPFTLAQGAAFNPGNIYTLQLSDASGNFGTPVNIGTLAGTSGGTIQGIIPVSTTTSGNYRLRIITSNPVDSSEDNGYNISITNTLVNKPVITSNSPVCEFHTLSLSANSNTSGVTYSWTGPNSFTSAVQSPSITNIGFSGAGNYIVTAILGGCKASDTETVVVNQVPAYTIVALANAPVCQHGILSLSSSSVVTGSTFSWTGPNGYTSNTQNSSVNDMPLAGAGDYIITATLNNCIVKDTVTVNVLAAPDNVNATTNAPICSGQTLNLNVANTTAGVTYNWVGPNSFTATTQSANISNATTAATGDYIATLSINGCTVKDTVTAVVHPMPGVPAASSNSPVCNNHILNLYAGNSLPGATYQWSGPNSFTSGQQNPTINNVNPGMAGKYIVTASLNGCTSEADTTNVTILYFTSSVSVYTLPNDTICAGGSIQFIAVASNGGTNPQYKWLKNGFPVSGATSISYTTGNLVTGDKFSVVLTPDNSCPEPDTSAPLEVTVLPWVTPSVSITATPNGPVSPWQTITFKATPVNGGKNPTYQWKRNGQDIVGAVYDTWSAYTLSNNDTISVVLFSDAWCPSPATATSNKILVTVNLGVNDIQVNGDWNIYPNPNNGSFTIDGNNLLVQEAQLSLTDAIGRVVYKAIAPVHNGKLHHFIATGADLPTGLYLLRISTGTEVIPIKINIRH